MQERECRMKSSVSAGRAFQCSMTNSRTGLQVGQQRQCSRAHRMHETDEVEREMQNTFLGVSRKAGRRYLVNAAAECRMQNANEIVLQYSRRCSAVSSRHAAGSPPGVGRCSQAQQVPKTAEMARQSQAEQVALQRMQHGVLPGAGTTPASPLQVETETSRMQVHLLPGE